MELRFSDEAEVVAQANDTPFGLAAYLYTQNIARAWRVVDALETGIVGLNEGALARRRRPSAASRNRATAAKAPGMAWTTTCTPSTFAKEA